MNAARTIQGLVALLFGGGIGYLAGKPAKQSERPPTVPPAAGIIATIPADSLGQRPGEHRYNRNIEHLMHADRDPAGALARLEAEVAYPHVDKYRNVYAALFEAWAHRDPEAAIAALAGIKNGPRGHAARAVIDAVYLEDPQRSADLLREWEHESWLPKWVLENPAEACALVPNIVASQDGADHYSAARSWAKTDPEAAVEWAGSLRGWQRHSAIEDAMGSWIEADVDAAAAALDAGMIQEWTLRQDTAKRIAQNMAYGDRPAEALAWLRDRVGHSRRSQTEEKILKKWAADDPEGAAAWQRERELEKPRW